MPTLLERAKAVSSARKLKEKSFNEEDFELVISLVKGEVTNKQGAKAKGINVGNIYSYIASVVKYLYSEDRIKFLNK